MILTLDEFALWLADRLVHNAFAYSGGDNEDADSDADDDSGSDDDSDDDSEDGDADGDSDDGADDSDSDDADVAKELRDTKRELRKANRDLQEALEMLEEQENRSSSSDSDDDDEEVVRLRDENAAMRALLNGPYIQSQINSFRDKQGNPRWSWEDAETVYALLDRSDLEVDPETGVIEGLEEQLEDLAKRKPFLLKKKGSSTRSSGNGSSGKPPRNSAGGEKKLSKDDFAKEFSVFNTLA